MPPLSRPALRAAREAVTGDAELITARDRAVDIQRGLELLLADAQLALNFRLAQQAEAQTRAALANHRAQEKLNTLAAWTLPLMAVGAVFGMNLRNGGETMDAWLFWAVLAAGMVMGWWVKVWVQRPAPPEKEESAVVGQRADRGEVGAALSANRSAGSLHSEAACAPLRFLRSVSWECKK